MVQFLFAGMTCELEYLETAGLMSKLYIKLPAQKMSRMTKWNFKEPDLTFSKGANKRNRYFDVEAKNIVDKESRKIMVNILQKRDTPSAT